MTKENPNKLCRSCHEFDYIMNRKSGVSLDVLIVCEHEEEITDYFCSNCFYNFNENEVFWHYNGVRLCPKCHPKDKKPCLENVLSAENIH